MPKIQLVAPPCPRCIKRGQLVRNLTVRSLLITEAKKRVEDIAYYLCMSSDCEVSYYSRSPNEVFTTKEVKVPIWYKKDASPKYACYCNEITEEEAFNAAKETGFTEMSGIIEFLREKVKCVCVAKNPSGLCCTPLFPEAIASGLRAKQKGN
ncbi:MAG: (2Fe-2S)-binding protein [Candidatus Heimdallarchaeota archaeon]|nr:(2Fe-2S)-binding protein [Candidatus Heimdallarchaeota archaeon]MCG3253868.1 (2Fe-2S)-binding protein [Candidatus Heimdallarchaeota archaeon]MCK4291002.1 (2Fe-2S)-binding protein [Candidatus Heimdallarchaeota archaeon]